MTSEILAVPEEDLSEVIDVIRSGIRATSVSKEVAKQLKNWCDEEEEYLKMLQDE